ncbi:MAG TPA: hypothetical protein VNX47_05835 [Nevskia sp.]|jgi:hypothetical protein|nr:hypothetical protein [Nevskia sp.]
MSARPLGDILAALTESLYKGAEFYPPLSDVARMQRVAEAFNKLPSDDMQVLVHTFRPEWAMVPWKPPEHWSPRAKRVFTLFIEKALIEHINQTMKLQGPDDG